AIPRPMPACTDGTFGTSFRQASYRVPYYVDTLGLDSPYDYAPLWETCLELKVAVTSHGGAHAWPDRRSISNFTFNHAGHFAQANEAFCKSVFLGGLTRRYPGLTFGFLEGGIGYAVNLLADLLEHWAKLD